MVGMLSLSQQIILYRLHEFLITQIQYSFPFYLSNITENLTKSMLIINVLASSETGFTYVSLKKIEDNKSIIHCKE